MVRRFVSAAVLVLSLVAVRPAAQTSSIIADVRALVAEQDFAGGERAIAGHRRANGLKPEAIEALSWLGRGALALKRWDPAEKYARETYDLSVAQLTTRTLDAEPHLPIALGAAIEVIAQVNVARGARSEAVAFLVRESARHRNTSILLRIQKNINLISLVGTTAPALDLSEFLGERPPALSALRGKVVLMFFWAHWCADCKVQGPILAGLQATYGPRGLTVVAPTQRYGYAAGGRDATPAEERRYIDDIRRTHYPALASTAIPLTEANHRRYGVSTTPTLVVVDRSGIIRLYHPGRMTESEIEPLVRDLLERGGTD